MEKMSKTERWEGKREEEKNSKRERVKIQKERGRESRDSEEERERKEGIRPEIHSLIIVCCDKPL